MAVGSEPERFGIYICQLKHVTCIELGEAICPCVLIDAADGERVKLELHCLQAPLSTYGMTFCEPAQATFEAGKGSPITLVPGWVWVAT